jgi:ADP-ribose pyrophosphatase YjhB (NUDIX family)
VIHNLKTQYFALFLEHNEHILLLQKKDARTNIWKIPGENKRLEIMVSNTLSRQIEKETGLKLSLSRVHLKERNLGSIMKYMFIMQF